MTMRIRSAQSASVTLDFGITAHLSFSFGTARTRGSPSSLKPFEKRPHDSIKHRSEYEAQWHHYRHYQDHLGYERQPGYP